MPHAVPSVVLLMLSELAQLYLESDRRYEWTLIYATKREQVEVEQDGLVEHVYCAGPQRNPVAVAINLSLEPDVRPTVRWQSASERLAVRYPIEARFLGNVDARRKDNELVETGRFVERKTGAVLRLHTHRVLSASGLQDQVALMPAIMGRMILRRRGFVLDYREGIRYVAADGPDFVKREVIDRDARVESASRPVCALQRCCETREGADRKSVRLKSNLRSYNQQWRFLFYISRIPCPVQETLVLTASMTPSQRFVISSSLRLMSGFAAV